MDANSPVSLLILNAPYYEDIARHLEDGARAALQDARASYEFVQVPGALEIPVALALAADAGLLPYDAPRGRFHGCVALGCVIRGETSHYDIVAERSAHGLMELATTRNIPVGNGILTVDTRDQALARARVDGGNKGAGAVNACIALVELINRFRRLKSEVAEQEKSNE